MLTRQRNNFCEMSERAVLCPNKRWKVPQPLRILVTETKDASFVSRHTRSDRVD